MKLPRPKFVLNSSKKNIPKDLLIEDPERKNIILGWSFAEDEA